MKVVKVILIFSIILLANSMRAQTTDPIEGVAQVLEHIDVLLRGGNESQLTHKPTATDDLPDAMLDIEQWRNAKIKSHTSKSGLEVRAGYD